MTKGYFYNRGGETCQKSLKYTEEGFADRVFHLHLRLTGDNDELYFRDYLCDHPEDAENYQLLKLSLWKKFEYNRDAYTDAKGDFIKRCTDLAHLAYGDRYATRTRETD
nr:GrpB family protein [Atopobium sp. BS2]